MDLPESLSYRLKRKLLGPPLVTEALATERLSDPIALGVLAPDCISSTAYGTEEILTELVPACGVAAFALLLPITFAVLAVLIFVTLSYREVVMAYTKAGGAYVVARENFGVKVAQVAAVALIIDYVVTVAVQTAAGTDALTSAFPVLKPDGLKITIGVVIVIAYGNLRGIKEAGRTFALPTYLFIGATGLVIVCGVIRTLLGQLHQHTIHLSGAVPAGTPGNGLLMGATLFVVLKSFANGGSSLTGLEAISNGVATFRPPEGKHARRTLVIMSTVLGSLVLGVSFVAWKTHAVPYSNGSPTVLSQEAHDVFGGSLLGHILFYVVQGSTMLILYTGANTSFNGFPNLASFVAKDAFLPRQLTKRGHRLVFSNGIMFLAVIAVVLLLVSDARVSSLVAVYAIGVFTGFTMAGAGMVRYHLRHKTRGWQRRLVINGFASVLSGIIVIIFAVTKFTEGAWTVVVLFPILVTVLIRLHHRYAEEQTELEGGVQRATETPILRKHEIIVFVERLDRASARALQYARSLGAGEPRAVHFMLDTSVARDLEEQWVRVGLERVSLEVVECPDRRLGRAALELVAEASADGETEVTVLLPRVVFEGALRRVLHDRTSDRLAELVGEVPNATATIVPFALGKRRKRLSLVQDRVAQMRLAGGTEKEPQPSDPYSEDTDLHKTLSPDAEEALRLGATSIGALVWRQRARVLGRVRSVRVQPKAGVPSLECTVVDASGQLIVVFQGRRLVGGIEPGARLLVEGTVGQRGGRMAMINPAYTILSGVGEHEEESSH